MTRPIVTSVSLDQETKEIAQTMPNFSGFVRECLKRWRNEQIADNNRHIHPIVRNGETVCYPFSKNGVCGLCWSDGLPTQDQWNQFIKPPTTPHSMFSEPSKPQLTITELKEVASNNNHRAAFDIRQMKITRLNEKSDQDRLQEKEAKRPYLKRLMAAILGN